LTVVCTLEIVLLAVLHQVDRVLDHLLFLPELRRVDYHQILAQVQLAHVFRQTAVHRERQRQLLLHLFLDVAGHLVLEQLLPTESFLGVCFEHPSNEVFAHLRDVIDGSREVEIFLSNHCLEFVDVLGIIGRSAWWRSYLPNSIQ
jgi:hypothetical protein